jgi:hypothetical protein
MDWRTNQLMPSLAKKTNLAGLIRLLDPYQDVYK